MYTINLNDEFIKLGQALKAAVPTFKTPNEVNREVESEDAPAESTDNAELATV